MFNIQELNMIRLIIEIDLPLKKKAENIKN